MHDLDVNHRDLKGKNIALKIEADGEKIIKILDFGLSKRQYNSYGQGSYCKSRVGTEAFMAPEVYGMNPENPYIYDGKKKDMYELGILLDKIVDIYNNFRDIQSPISQELKNRLINRLLRDEPENRPSIDYCLEILESYH